MIKGEKKQSLQEQIKSSLTDYDIYRMFCPTKFTVGKKFSSPIPGRRDSNPSFLIGCKNGNYYHIDFGDSTYRGDAIEFVKQMLSTDYPGALQAIGNQFGISTGKWKTIVREYQQPEIIDDTQIVSIEYIKRKFTQDAHKYWNSYHLSEDYLKEKMVFQVRSLYLARKKFAIPEGEIVFVYDTPEGLRKIYRPTISRKVPKEDQQKLWRFRGNLPFTYIFGKDNIKNCNKSLILKSRKDELVTSLLMPCVSSVQAESIACFSKENVDYINQNSKETFLIFGSDPQGVRESKLITETFGWKHFNTPSKYLPMNDPAEIAKNYGLQELENLLKQKSII